MLNVLYIFMVVVCGGVASPASRIHSSDKASMLCPADTLYTVAALVTEKAVAALTAHSAAAALGHTMKLLAERRERLLGRQKGN